MPEDSAIVRRTDAGSATVRTPHLTLRRTVADGGCHPDGSSYCSACGGRGWGGGQSPGPRRNGHVRTCVVSAVHDDFGATGTGGALTDCGDMRTARSSSAREADWACFYRRNRMLTTLAT